jgi:hypothetical protein
MQLDHIGGMVLNTMDTIVHVPAPYSCPTSATAWIAFSIEAGRARPWHRQSRLRTRSLPRRRFVAYGSSPMSPSGLTHYEHQKGLAGHPMLTRTAQGIPGDPINVGLVGAKADVLCAMHDAAWYPADPITLRSSVEIIGSVVLDRPYRDAPVSRLFYDGRREDLAFEKPDGTSADRRQHVRFWES